MLKGIFFGIAVATQLSACTATMVLPPSKSLRDELKVLGLSGDTEKRVDPPKEPLKGTGSAALSGAGQGAVGTFVGTAHGFCEAGGPLGCAIGVVLGAVLAPVGAVVGAGVGASKSHSEEEVESAHQATMAVLQKLRPTKELTDQFVDYITERHGTTIVPVDCAITRERCEAKTPHEPKYFIRLGYSNFVIHSYGRIDPDVQVTATASAEIFELSDQRKVYGRQWGYAGSKASYFDLAKNHGVGLAELITNAHKRISSQIIYDLMEGSEPTPIAPEKENAVWTISGPLVERSEYNSPHKKADEDSDTDDF